MKIIVLTNCIFREKFIEEQLHLLGYEVFISETLLIEPLSMVRFFDMIILSDTLPSAQQLVIAKEMRSFHVPILKVSREDPQVFKDTFAGVLEPDSDLEELGNRLAAIKKVTRRIKPKRTIPYVKQKKTQDFTQRFSKLESKLLDCLKEARGGIVSKRELAIHLWEGEPTTSQMCHISNIVKRIREKLDLYQLDQFEVITVWGKGYYLEPANGWGRLEENSKQDLDRKRQKTLV